MWVTDLLSRMGSGFEKSGNSLTFETCGSSLRSDARCRRRARGDLRTRATEVAFSTVVLDSADAEVCSASFVDDSEEFRRRNEAVRDVI